MKITSRGQVTIPRAIRERFGLLQGTKVELVVDGNAVRIVKGPTHVQNGKRIVERLRGRATRSR